MPTTTLKLVTIVTERLMRDELLEKIRELGARGYTLSEVYGRGSRGVRASEWEGPDAKIEAVVSDEVADRIINYVADHYFEHYAVIVYAHPVDVVRGDKYV